MTITTAAALPGRGTEEAYRDLRARLRDFIARRVESSETADDLTQDVLLRLVRSNPDELPDPTAWLYRVARNVIIDHYRTRRPTAKADLGGLAHPVDDPFADDPTAARRELARCLRGLVGQLPEPYQSAITVVDLGGATQASAAAAAGITLPGMKSRVQRGRRQLRELLTTCCAVETSVDGAALDYTAPPACRLQTGCGSN